MDTEILKIRKKDVMLIEGDVTTLEWKEPFLFQFKY